jgi:hypothetical protein
MQHTISASNVRELNLLASYGRDVKTLTFENRGATSVFLVPGAMPLNTEQLPPVVAPDVAWDSVLAIALNEYCRRCGFELKAGERVSRSVEDGREINLIWTVDADVTNTQLYSIVEK